jgi:hypothetical protein
MQLGVCDPVRRLDPVFDWEPGIWVELGADKIDAVNRGCKRGDREAAAMRPRRCRANTSLA